MAFIKQDRDQIDITHNASDVLLTTKDDTTIINAATDTTAGLMTAADRQSLQRLLQTDVVTDFGNVYNWVDGDDLVRLTMTSKILDAGTYLVEMFVNLAYDSSTRNIWMHIEHNGSKIGEEFEQESADASGNRNNNGNLINTSATFIQTLRGVVTTPTAQTISIDLISGKDGNNREAHIWDCILNVRKIS